MADLLPSMASDEEDFVAAVSNKDDDSDSDNEAASDEIDASFEFGGILVCTLRSNFKIIAQT